MNLAQELAKYLDTLTITGDNIGDIRRECFVPWDSQWNGIVRDETAAREGRPAAATISGRMKINYERHGRCFWHEDCEKARQGVMKVTRHEAERSVIECLHCGRSGYYPVGGNGPMCVEEIVGTGRDG
jgi:RNase P subunit RPR2